MKKERSFSRSLFEEGEPHAGVPSRGDAPTKECRPSRGPVPRSPEAYGTFAVLDLGTEKVSCSIGSFQPVSPKGDKTFLPLGLSFGRGGGHELPHNASSVSSMTLLGFGQRASKGVTPHGICDLEALRDTLLNAISSAEEMAQQNIKEVYVSIPASWVKMQRIVTKLSLPSPSPIQSIHLRKLFYTAQTHTLEGHPCLIHLWPLSYRLDDLEGIHDPTGMIGKTLSATCLVVTASRTTVQNLSHCIGQCALDIAGMVVDPYAAGLACLAPDEAELGATLIDVGGFLTQIACFYEGKVAKLDTVPLGGAHITSDLARGLSTNRAQAERIKVLYGSLAIGRTRSDELVPMTPMGTQIGPNVAYVSRERIEMIMRARVNEILDKVDMALQRMSQEVNPAAFQKILLTGGACQLPGWLEVAQERWPASYVRLAYPGGVNGPENVIRSLGFSTAAGLLCCAAQAYQGHPMTAYDSKPLGFFQRFWLWLSEYL